MERGFGVVKKKEAIQRWLARRELLEVVGKRLDHFDDFNNESLLEQSLNFSSISH